MFERLSQKSIKVVMFAQEEARKLGDTTVDIDHLLLGLMREAGSVACQVLIRRGIAYEDLREYIRNLLPRAGGSSGELPFSPHFRQALELAWEEAQHLGDTEIDTEHLLLGAVEMGEGAAVRYLEGDNLSLGRLRWSVLRQRDSYQGQPQNDTPTVDAYCVDLTQQLDSGRLQDPLVPRAREMERLMQVLGGVIKPMPLLVGESGVGKTTLIHGCVSNILSGYTFDHLLNCRVLALDFPRLLAETHGHEELYELFQKIVLELARTGDIILVIENLDWLFGEEFDARMVLMAQLLLPLLAGRQQRCAATVTPRGLAKLENREGLLRLFQPVSVPEMSPDETRQILAAWQPVLEHHHRLTVGEEAIAAAIALAKHFRPGGFLPEAALALMDAACAAKVYHNLQSRNRLRELERRLRQLREERDQSGQRLDFARLNAIKERIADHEAAIRDLTTSGNGAGSRRVLTADDVKIMLGRGIS